jgi:hypothetical protein
MSVPASQWDVLFRIALSIIDKTSAAIDASIPWTVGGGTALMLQIGHRQSHDIDIFVEDPQWLALFNPETQGYDCEIVPHGYSGDGASFLKIAFGDVGEIDFIVGAGLTKEPAGQMQIEGRAVAVETVAEIITKKVFYRGSSIKARDIFDIAAAAKDRRDEIVLALSSYPERVAGTLEKLQKLNPEFVDAAINALAISGAYRNVAGEARQRAAEVLRAAAPL